ncbi:MAG: histidine kinase [Prevotellaceae bacterium]|jgi:signal transduction histidine kinase|nr:histidine kinase [Prevotellaceae bacterium]
MATALKLNKDPRFLSFSRKFFLSMISLFLVFVACFIVYQYNREKAYKVELLNNSLQQHNNALYNLLSATPDSLKQPSINNYVTSSGETDLRITMIDATTGAVLYDSYRTHGVDNHLNRPEVEHALHDGRGYDVRRTSATTGLTYFYSATRYGNIIIRTALPYNVTLIQYLSADIHFIWFTALLTVLLAFILYKFTIHMGLSVASQEQAEQSRLKRELTQNIAHELKTPVSSIQGYLETIVSNPGLSPDKRQTFLERCYAQSNRLSLLLRDISVLTRMNEASDMIEMEAIDVGEMVEQMLSELALELEEKDITVVNRLPSHLFVYGDHSLIYSIFRNLIDNAIAYAGTHISIYIRCYREDDTFYYFRFADTGVGVPPEHLNRLFERFYRVDKGRSRKLGGTGLGLAIVKNAILIHGGNITVSNDGGLKFEFSLKRGHQHHK